VFPDSTAAIGVEKLATQFRSAPKHVGSAAIQQIENRPRSRPTWRNRDSSPYASFELFPTRLHRRIPFHEDPPSQKVWNVWLECTTFRDGMKIRAICRPPRSRQHRAGLAGGSRFGGNRTAGQGAEPWRVKGGESSFENHIRFIFAEKNTQPLVKRNISSRASCRRPQPAQELTSGIFGCP
jgi:hypothetical protein